MYFGFKMFHTGSFRNHVWEVLRKLQQTWVLWNPVQVWGATARRASRSRPTRYQSPGRHLGTALPGAWSTLQCHTLLKTQELLVWGLVLPMGRGSKHRTAEQVDFKLREHWIIAGISLKLSVVMTLEAFVCSIDHWISLLSHKRNVLSCSVLYKFIISFHYILFRLFSLICASIRIWLEMLPPHKMLHGFWNKYPSNMENDP